MSSSKQIKSGNVKKAMLVAGLLLAAFTLIAALLVAITYQNTSSKIDQNKRDYVLKSLHDVMPATEYNNDLLADSYTVSDTLLGPDPNVIYPAFKNTKPVGAIISVIAPDGYNGKIKLLVGVNFSGVIHAVRVVEHRETPGLGDPIDIKRSDWIRQFRQHSLTYPALEKWQVKKDGGDFDQLTGATITPRAVIKAVSNALLYYQANQDQIYTSTNKKPNAN